MVDDWQLLDQCGTGDEAAFAELVRRHVDAVYGVARRSLGGPGTEAEDVAQAVFFLLAHKGAKIPRKGALAGWLFRVTRYCCRDVRKHEGRRRQRETEAAMRRGRAANPHALDEGDAMRNAELAKQLDAALEGLGEKERQAILVRYFAGKTVAETAAALGISAVAAEKRLGRGLGKLRQIFAVKGVAAPAASVGGVTALLATEAAKAAPAGFAAGVTIGGGGTSAAAVGIAKGAATMMKVATMKVAGLAGCLVLVLGMVGAVVATEFRGVKPEVAGGPEHAAGTGAPIAFVPAGTTAAVPAPPETEMPITYRAVVRDENGKPLAGVKVRLEQTDFDRAGVRVLAEAVTAADGTFALGPVKPLAYYGFRWRMITVDAPGYAWSWWDGRNRHALDDDAVRQIVLGKPQEIAGVVLDEQAKPIAGAAVSLELEHGDRTDYFDCNKENGRGVRTDDHGRFVFTRIPADGRAFLSVKCAGYVTENGWSNVTEPAVTAGMLDQRVVLKRGGTARVQLAKEGKPFKLANVTVRAIMDGKRIDFALTDASGVVDFSGLGAGNYSFEASGPALGQAGLAVMQPPAAKVKVGETSDVQLLCVPGRLVRGQLVRAGSSVAHTIVTVIPKGQLPGEFYGEVGEDGRFSLALAPGTYVMWAQGLQGRSRLNVDGARSKTFTVEAGKKPIDMTIKLGDLWQGRLVNEKGEGVRGSVYGDCRVETRADGRFALPSEQSPELGIAWDKDKKNGSLFFFGTGEGEHLVQMQPMGEIDGEVRVPEGRKLSEVTMHLWINVGPQRGEALGEGLWHYKLNEDGSFVIAPVPVSEDTYVVTEKDNAGEPRKVTVGQEMRVSVEMKGSEGYSNDVFGLAPGGATDVGVIEMTGQEGRGDPKDWKSAVSGRVVNEKGAPMKGLRVGTRIIKGPSAVTDLEGRFTLTGLPAGKVEVGVWQFGVYRATEATVESPAKDVVLKMDPQGWEWYGKEAPELMVDHWVSGDVKGIRELRGKVVLLVVGMDARRDLEWERLRKLQEKYGAKGLKVVVVPCNPLSKGEVLSAEGQEQEARVADATAMGKKMGLAVGIDGFVKEVDASVPRNSWARGATELIYGVRDRMGEGAVFLVDRKGVLVGAVGEDVEERVAAMMGK